MRAEDDDSRVDAAIGERIRRRRTELGLTQEQLAQRLGVSYQQVQKYERGANRISASRLFALAHRLDVAPGWFFADLDPPTECVASNDGAGLELARACAGIPDDEVRAAVVVLLQALAARQS
jgi:transcriptional regulator with XRE-family HTH domain